MIYASVCTGIATDELAFPDHWACAWSSEVAKFPSRLLAHYYPDTPNLGDMRALAHKKANHYGWIRSKPIGLLVGGTPCQSFSVAGKRGGLDDQRGNLAITFARLAGICRPQWVLWENVPGVRSSNDGRDFGAFLGALADRGYHLAYRELDAQWFGLAQRRRRVYVVGHLGDWRRAAAVLFDPASLRWDSPARRKSGEEIAGTLGASSEGRGWRADLDTSGAYIPEISGPVTSLNARLGNEGSYTPDLVASDLTTEVAKCLTARGSRLAARGSRLAADAETYVPELSHCLTGGGFDASEDGTGRGTPLVAHAITENQRGEVRMMDVSPSLGLGGGKPGQGYPSTLIGARVRRLMPIECERLQGLPDNYTAIPDATDSERYAAIGNGWPRNVVEWIARRIEAVSKT